MKLIVEEIKRWLSKWDDFRTSDVAIGVVLEEVLV